MKHRSDNHLSRLRVPAHTRLRVEIYTGIYLNTGAQARGGGTPLVAACGWAVTDRGRRATGTASRGAHTSSVRGFHKADAEYSHPKKNNA